MPPAAATAEPLDQLTLKYEKLKQNMHYYSETIELHPSLLDMEVIMANKKVLEAHIATAGRLLSLFSQNSKNIDDIIDKSSKVFDESRSEALKQLNIVKDSKTKDFVDKSNENDVQALRKENDTKSVNFAKDPVILEIDNNDLSLSDHSSDADIKKNVESEAETKISSADMLQRGHYQTLPISITLNKKYKVSLDCVTDLSAYENLLFCSSTDFTITCIDLEQNSLSAIPILRGSESEILSVTTACNGRLIIGGTFSTGIYVWDLNCHESGYNKHQEHEQDERIFLPENFDILKSPIVDLKSCPSNRSPLFFSGSPTENQEINPDTKYSKVISALKVCSEDDCVDRIEKMATLPNMDANSQFFLQADMQDALVVMQPSANAIDIYDIETFKPINEYVFEHKSSKMQCSDMLPTTGLFACAYDNFEIAFFDTRSSSPASDSSPIAPFLAHSTTINCLRLLDSPSLCLLTSSTDGILRLWDLRMAREAKIKSRDQTLCCFDSLVHSHKNDFCMSALEFVPNSPPTVCTAGYDGCVNIFSFD